MRYFFLKTKYVPPFVFTAEDTVSISGLVISKTSFEFNVIPINSDKIDAVIFVEIVSFTETSKIV